MMSTLKLVVLLQLLPVVLSLAINPRGTQGRFQGTAVLPNDDPFYAAPPGIDSASAGKILRYRPVPNPITLDNKSPIVPKAAWQIQYRSQNSVGEPNAPLLTLLVPTKPKKNNLFVIHYFTDSSYNGCNPSMALQVGTRKDNEFVQIQTAIIVEALSRGWYVSIADDSGPQAAFGSGLQSAYATLDSIRAVKQSGNFTGIDPDPIVTMFGYSGGGVAAVWTTELQPTYAPDLKIAGAALGGLVPNVTATVAYFDKKIRASFVPPYLLGMARDYKNLSSWLKENLVPEHEAEFRKAETQCMTSNDEMYANQSMGRYFKRGLESLYDPVPFSVLEATGSMGLRGTPKVPWYLYETIWDDISPVALTDALVEKHCAKGASIQYERNSIVELVHSQEAVWGLPGAFIWMADRYKGVPITPGCNTSSFSNESGRALYEGTLLTGVLNNVMAWFGMPLKRVVVQEPS